MEYFKCIRSIHILILAVMLSFFLYPQSSSALRPLNDDDLTGNSPALKGRQTGSIADSHLRQINEKQLDELSPSLVAPQKVTIPPKEFNRLMDQEFVDSICFKRCHQSGDFHPSDNTAKQWRLLIEQDGHFIFGEIPWESKQQKKEILDYLLNNARNSRPGSAGIGVW